MRTIFNQAIFEALNSSQWPDDCNCNFARVLETATTVHGIELKGVAAKTLKACLQIMETKVRPAIGRIRAYDPPCKLHASPEDYFDNLVKNLKTIEDFEGLTLEDD